MVIQFIIQFLYLKIKKNIYMFIQYMLGAAGVVTTNSKSDVLQWNLTSVRVLSMGKKEPLNF